MRHLLLIELDDIELSQLQALASINNAGIEQEAARLISERVAALVDAEIDGLLIGVNKCKS